MIAAQPAAVGVERHLADVRDQADVSDKFSAFTPLAQADVFELLCLRCRFDVGRQYVKRLVECFVLMRGELSR
jgi:hypothetical protein